MLDASLTKVIAVTGFCTTLPPKSGKTEKAAGSVFREGRDVASKARTAVHAGAG
jgi:hypothetical protein